MFKGSFIFFFFSSVLGIVCFLDRSRSLDVICVLRVRRVLRGSVRICGRRLVLGSSGIARWEFVEIWWGGYFCESGVVFEIIGRKEGVFFWNFFWRCFSLSKLNCYLR